MSRCAKDSYLAKATLGLALVWALNWMFFDIDNRHEKHALARSFKYSLSLRDRADDSTWTQLCYEFCGIRIDIERYSTSSNRRSVRLRYTCRRVTGAFCVVIVKSTAQLSSVVLYVRPRNRCICNE